MSRPPFFGITRRWEVTPFLAWWSWLFGWSIEWHPTEATLQVHLGPLSLWWWWQR